MYQAKTRPTAVKVSTYLAAIADDERRRDCKQLAALMKRVTGTSPKMWGPSIVGFGRYHYRYASGHEGEICLVGFSSRKAEISIYLLCGQASSEVKKLLAQLGKHKRGKACLYIKRLAEINLPVLEKLVAHAIAETQRQYPVAEAPKRQKKPSGR